MQRRFGPGGINPIDTSVNLMPRRVRRLSFFSGVNWLYGGAHLLILAAAAQIDSPRVWPYALAAMAILSFAAWVGNYRRMRSINDTPTSRVVSAAQGYVELMGRAQHLSGDAMVSELSHTPCTWYRYLIEERGRRNRWSHAGSGESSEPFALRDESGLCVVAPEGAEIISSNKRTWISGRYRYTEWLLLAGDPLYAIGCFATVGGVKDDREIAKDISRILNLWKSDRPHLLERFDLNRDGTLDMREWELARRQARREATSGPRHTSNEGTHLLRCPEDGRLFLISNCTPARLSLQYRLWSLAHIVVFLCAGPLAVMLFEGRFKW